MKIHHYLLLLASFGLMASCKKEDSVPAIDNTPYGQLKVYTARFKDSGKILRTEFLFKTKDTLDRILFTNAKDKISTTEQFKYDAAGLLKESNYVKNLDGKFTTISRTYAYKDGKINTITDQVDKTKKDAFYNFYNIGPDGRQKDMIRREVIGPTNYYRGEITYSWKGNNVLIKEERLPDNTLIEYEYQIGNDINPLYTIYNTFLKIPTEDPTTLNKNNILAYKEFWYANKYKVEPTLNAEQKIIAEKIYIFKNNEWVVIQENTFEYYEKAK